MNHRRNAVAGLLTAAAIAGCGSSSSGITPAAYRVKVDKLCTSNNNALRSLPSSDANSVAGLEAGLSIDTHTLAAIKGVDVPSAISGQAHSWLTTLEHASAAATLLVGDLKHGDSKQAAALVPTDRTLSTLGNKQASALGLPDCAESASPGEG